MKINKWESYPKYPNGVPEAVTRQGSPGTTDNAAHSRGSSATLNASRPGRDPDPDADLASGMLALGEPRLILAAVYAPSSSFREDVFLRGEAGLADNE